MTVLYIGKDGKLLDEPAASSSTAPKRSKRMQDFLDTKPWERKQDSPELFELLSSVEKGHILDEIVLCPVCRSECFTGDIDSHGKLLCWVCQFSGDLDQFNVL